MTALFRILHLLAGALAGLMIGLLLSAEQREKLSRQLASRIEKKVAYMPDG